MLRKSLLTKVAVLTLGVFVVASSIAEAQGRRQRGRQGGRGFGGFGGDRTFGMLATNEYLQNELKLTSAQKKRMEEIRLQMQGTRALTSDTVVKTLGISNTQKEAIEKAQRDAYSGLFGGGRRRGGNNNQGQKRPSGEDIRKRFEDARKKAEESVMKVLTSAQQSKWKSMLGAPVDRSKLNTFGGGGRGGQPGGGRKKRPDV